MSDVAKTPREELECKKKYLYEHSMFWECNDGCKCQILEDDVVDLLNELSEENEQLKSDIMLIEKNADRHYEENVQLKKEKAKLTERLRECSMRLDRFNCR